jgi:hypothetical protein
MEVLLGGFKPEASRIHRVIVGHIANDRCATAEAVERSSDVARLTERIAVAGPCTTLR